MWVHGTFQRGVGTSGELGPRKRQREVVVCGQEVTRTNVPGKSAQSGVQWICEVLGGAKGHTEDATIASRRENQISMSDICATLAQGSHLESPEHQQRTSGSPRC